MTATGRAGGSTIWRKREAERIEAVAARLLRLPLVRVRGTLYRAVYNAYLHPPALPGGAMRPPEPLYFLGSLAGRRFTPYMGPAGLYLSFDASTPPAELRSVVFDKFGMPKPGQPGDPFTTVSVTGVIHGVVDLTVDAHLTALDLAR